MRLRRVLRFVGLATFVVALTAACGDGSKPTHAAGSSSTSVTDTSSSFASTISASTPPDSTSSSSSTATTDTTVATSVQSDSTAAPQTLVIDDTAIAQAPAAVDLAVHPNDRIEIHLTRTFYNYSCCDVSGDGSVLTVLSGPSTSGGNVDGAYVVAGVGQATLTGEADPSCRQTQPPCGSPSYRITVNVTST